MRTTTSLLFAAAVACAVAWPFVGSAPDAVAAPAASPFAGTYDSSGDDGFWGTTSSTLGTGWTITVDTKGHVSGSETLYLYPVEGPGGVLELKLRGQIDSHGGFSGSVSEGSGWSKFTAQLAPTTGGDVTGTYLTGVFAGQTFAWYRR